MNCGEYRLQASALLDGELAAGEIRDLFRHLAVCDSCWKYNLRLEKIHRVLGDGASLNEREETDRQSWTRRKLPVSAPSFLLSLFMAFVFGMVLSLMLQSLTIPGQREQEFWQRSGLLQPFTPAPPHMDPHSETGLKGAGR